MCNTFLSHATRIAWGMHKNTFVPSLLWIHISIGSHYIKSWFMVHKSIWFKIENARVCIVSLVFMLPLVGVVKLYPSMCL